MGAIDRDIIDYMDMSSKTEVVSTPAVGSSRSTTTMPEKSLLLAVVQRAILDLVDKDPKIREEVF